MRGFRKIGEDEASEIARNSEAGRMLVIERDMLRELVKAKDEYIACYKTGKRPSEKLFRTLDRLIKEVGE
jgi:hypothetical protein